MFVYVFYMDYKYKILFIFCINIMFKKFKLNIKYNINGSLYCIFKFYMIDYCNYYKCELII